MLTFRDVQYNLRGNISRVVFLNILTQPHKSNSTDKGGNNHSLLIGTSADTDSCVMLYGS